jgi:hypothetical protein
MRLFRRQVTAISNSGRKATVRQVSILTVGLPGLLAISCSFVSSDGVASGDGAEERPIVTDAPSPMEDVSAPERSTVIPPPSVAGAIPPYSVELDLSGQPWVGGVITATGVISAPDDSLARLIRNGAPVVASASLGLPGGLEVLSVAPVCSDCLVIVNEGSAQEWMSHSWPFTLDFDESFWFTMTLRATAAFPQKEMSLWVVDSEYQYGADDGVGLEVGPTTNSGSITPR